MEAEAVDEDDSTIGAEEEEEAVAADTITTIATGTIGIGLTSSEVAATTTIIIAADGITTATIR